jgi:hypothetical protein
MKRAVLFGGVFLLSLGHAIAATPPPILKLSLPFKGTLALAVLDARPDVVSGDRKETFVGFSRSLYGIPYPAYTPSRQPLAQDLSDLITLGLKLGGTPAQSIKASPFNHRDGAIKALQATGAERLILVEIRDWWTDTLIHTDLHYDLGLTVLNSQGQELGSTSVAGHEELGRRQRPERRDVPTATSDVFSTLFAAGPVTSSFAADAQPAVRKASCSVDQILKMKEAGLSQEQIESACGASNH